MAVGPAVPRTPNGHRHKVAVGVEANVVDVISTPDVDADRTMNRRQIGSVVDLHAVIVHPCCDVLSVRGPVDAGDIAARNRTHRAEVGEGARVPDTDIPVL